MTARFLELIHRQRRAILAGLAILCAAGVVSPFLLPAAILPEVAFPRITVIADRGEQPAEEMVRLITRPLEESLRRVSEIQEIRSTTSRGSAEIQVDFDWHARMDRVFQLVEAQIESVRERLPAGTTVEARRMSPTEFPVLGFSLTSHTKTLAELRDVATYQIRPQLALLPGVSDVVIQGGHRPEARVTLDPAKLEARRLDPATIAEAVRRNSELQSVGLLEANRELYLGLADARPASLEALRALPVPVDSGPPIPLGTLGKVAIEPAPEFTRYVAGPGDAVMLNVLRKPSASTIALSQSAHRWFRDHARALPADVTIQTFYDQADLVRGGIDSVRDSLLVGALMAVLIVVAFLRSMRLGLAGAIVLPGSIALTLLALALTHQSLNLMTLGGIAAAVGLVLDDAIVVVEHVAHRVAGRVDPSAIRAAIADITPTLLGSSLCTLAIFIPFIYLSRVTGAFFRVLALSMVLMLTASFLLCVTVVPWMRVGALRAGSSGSGFWAWLDRPRRAMAAHRWTAVAVSIALVAAIVPLRATLGSGFLPEMDEGALILDYVAPPGLSLDETDRLLRTVEREIARVPEIAVWSRRTGDQLGFFITEPNTGDYVLRLTSGHRRPADEIADELRGRIGRVAPALDFEFGQLVEDVVGDLTTSPEPIEVRVLHEDRHVAEQRASQVARVLESVRGVVDVRSGVVVSGPSLSLVPGPSAQRAGLSPEDLATRVSLYAQGIEAGQIPRGARGWPIRLLFPPRSSTQGAQELANARVPISAGHWARLGDVADLRIEPGESEISRDNLRTMVAATARLSGRDLGSAMHEIQRRVDREVALAPGMTVRYAGLWSEAQSSFRSLAIVLVGAALAVLLVLVVSFRSWRRAGAVLLVASASLPGALAALLIGGATFNIASFVGAIMVVGIVAENAYFLVAEHQALLAAGATPEAASEAAARRRSRPVLMTSAAGIAALAPLAIGFGSGSALLRPLALAVVGGFVTSAPLLLFVLPALLARSGREVEAGAAS